MQPPGDLGRDMLTQPIEAHEVERLGSDGQARSGFERRPLTQRGGRGDGIAQTLEICRRAGEELSRRGGVPARSGDLAEEEARQGGGALVSGGDLRAQRSLEEESSARVVLPRQEQLTASLARLRCALLISRSLV